MHQKTKGFTLVELLVTIAIIGILASIIVVNISGARKQARDAKRQSELKAIQTALEQYANQNAGVYPDDVAALVPTFLASVPADPTPGQSYEYHLGTCTDAADTARFIIAAKLEVKPKTAVACPNASNCSDGSCFVIGN